MNRRALFKVVTGSIRRYHGYATALILMQVAAILVPMMALSYARDQTSALTDSFVASGSQSYVVTWPGSSGTPLELPPDMQVALRSMSATDSVIEVGNVSATAQSSLDAGLHLPVAAVEPGLFRIAPDMPIRIGRLPAANETGWAVLTAEAAKLLNMSTECHDGQCSVTIQGEEWPIIGVLGPVSTELIVTDNGPRVFVDYRTAVASSLVKGPDTLVLNSKALPFELTAKSYTLVAQEFAPGIDVVAPEAAAALRGSVTGFWGEVLTYGSLVVSGLVLAGISLVLSMYLRRRRGEVALLRTIGFTPAACTQAILVEVLVLCAISSSLALVLGYAAVAGGVSIDTKFASVFTLVAMTITPVLAWTMSYRQSWKPPLELLPQG